MSGFVLAQTSPSGADLGLVLRRLLQGGLWTPPGSTALLVLFSLIWFLVLAIVSGLIQRDWTRWVRGLVDIRGHFDQLGAGLAILRRNKRPLWLVLVAAILSWTGWSLRVWKENPAAELEGMLAIHNNSVASFAAAYAFTAALTPWRDLASLGDLLPLMVVACLVLFARTADLAQHLRARVHARENIRLKRRVGTIWVGLIILIGYRLAMFLADPSQAPLGGCLYVDSLILPLLVLVADGLLFNWILTEFGRALRGHFDWQSDDTVALIRGVPAAMLVCGLTNPGRYVLLAGAMLVRQVNPITTWPAVYWVPMLWGSEIARLAGLAWFAAPGVLAVCRSSKWLPRIHAYWHLLRRAGGQVVGLTALAVLLNILATLPFYWLFGAMQPETWSLLGAASYGHYATLLVGLVVLAGITELAHREVGLEDEPHGIPSWVEPGVAEAAAGARS